MKTNCEPWFEEIAAFASEAAKLSPEAAAHVHGCARCRKKIAAWQAVAGLHREAAAHLAEPKRCLSRRRLAEVLAKGRRRGHPSEIRWKPVLAMSVAIGLILSAAAISRRPRHGMNSRLQGKQQQTALQTSAEPSDPTMLALRRGLAAKGEPMLAGATGAGMRHYRVKDTDSELKLGTGMTAGEP
jgi:hypothetical protein